MGRSPPRAHAGLEAEGDALIEAQDDAALLALRDQERAELDVVGDGEVRRGYFNRFANAVQGIDIDNPALVANRRGVPVPVPQVTGPIKRVGPVRSRKSPLRAQ